MDTDIDQLIAGYVDGTLQADERQQLLQACEDNDAVLQELAAHRGLADALQAATTSDPERTWAALAPALAQDTDSRRLHTVERMEQALAGRRRPLRWLIAALILFSIGAWWWTKRAEQTPEPISTASVIMLGDGGLHIERDGTAFAGSAISSLQPGDRVVTHGKGEAVLHLDDAAHLLLDANTTLTIDRVGTKRAWHLERGGLSAHLNATSVDQYLQVTTPHLSVDVVGTTFRLAARKRKSRIAVIAGTVAVTGAGIDRQRITAGLQIESTATDSQRSPTIPGIPLDQFAALPELQNLYANGRFSLAPDEVTLTPLWPIELSEDLHELSNDSHAQANHRIPFGGCALPAFAITFDAQIASTAPTYEFAIVQEGTFTATGYPKLRFTGKGRIVAIAPTGEWHQAKRYRTLWQLAGYVPATGKPVYETVTSIDGTTIGHGFTLGAPQSITLGLRAVKARISAMQLHAIRPFAPD